MLADAAALIATRQASKKAPRTYRDYREMLKERDLDIALIGTPDHWHALPAIAAIKAGAHLYLQKPVGVDVVEGQAILAAARKYKRVVQVGTQRRSTPHLINARNRVIKEGLLGKVGFVEIYCYYHMRTRENPPDTTPPGDARLRDVDGAGADASLQQARPPAQLARLHGIRQRHRRRHVHPHARHGAVDARSRHAAAGEFHRRHPGRQGQQGQHQRHADGDVRLRRPAGRVDASHLRRGARPEVPVGRDHLRRQGHAQGERDGLGLHRRARAARRCTRT